MLPSLIAIMFLLIATQAHATLIGWWKLDETGTMTSVTDSSGNGLNGSLCNGTTCPQQGPTWVLGKYANGMRCTASGNNNVQVADNALLDITGDLTISFWMIMHTSPGASDNDVVLSKTQSTGDNPTPWHIEIDGATAHFLYYHHMTGGDYSTGLLYSGYTVPTGGAFHHYAFVRTVQDKRVRFYVDGAESANLTYTNDLPEVSSTGMFMCAPWSLVSTRYADITLDNIRLYSHALTPEEIIAEQEQDGKLASNRTPIARDNFNRASLGANWSVMDGNVEILSSSHIHGTGGGDNSALYTPAVLNANQYVQVKLSPSLPTGGAETHVSLRDTSTVATNNKYEIITDGASYNDICKWVANSFSCLSLTTIQAVGTWVNGDTLGAEAEGPSIYLVRNGIRRLRATDTSLTSGQAGIAFYSTTAYADDFECGNLGRRFRGAPMVFP